MLKKRKLDTIGPLVPQFNYTRQKQTLYIGPILFKMFRILLVAGFLAGAAYMMT